MLGRRWWSGFLTMRYFLVRGTTEKQLEDVGLLIQYIGRCAYSPDENSASALFIDLDQEDGSKEILYNCSDEHGHFDHVKKEDVAFLLDAGLAIASCEDEEAGLNPFAEEDAPFVSYP